MVKRINPLFFKKRLLKLADFGDSLLPEQFNFRCFVGENWKGRANLSCGTNACMFGWSTTIPSFRRLGLRMSMSHMDIVAWPHLAGDRVAFESTLRAGEVIFGLSEHEFKYLFLPYQDLNNEEREYQKDNFESVSPDRNATAQQVAEHIRSFVKYKYGDGNA
jgi:hypothetical protein